MASYFASDLIHRLFHADKIGEGTVFHYADTYTECLDLARESPDEAVRNAHTLQYFALDVYAYDIALPGQGCTGEPIEEEETESAAESSTTSASSSSSTSSAEVASVTQATSTTDAVESTTESATESAESVSHAQPSRLDLNQTSY